MTVITSPIIPASIDRMALDPAMRRLSPEAALLALTTVAARLRCFVCRPQPVETVANDHRIFQAAEQHKAVEQPGRTLHIGDDPKQAGADSCFAASSTGSGSGVG